MLQPIGFPFRLAQICTSVRDAAARLIRGPPQIFSSSCWQISNLTSETIELRLRGPQVSIGLVDKLLGIAGAGG